MTIDIKQHRELLARATPRPWGIYREEVVCGYFSYLLHEEGHGGHHASTAEQLHDEAQIGRARADAELIKAAINSHAELLDEVEQLRKRLGSTW